MQNIQYKQEPSNVSFPIRVLGAHCKVEICISKSPSA